MASYFTLELDTTPPQLEIIAPPNTVVGLENEIRILSNETLLLNQQEIYVVSNSGVRTDLTLSYDTTEFRGEVVFTRVGIYKVYAKLFDSVLNQSALVEKTINVKGVQELLQLEYTDNDYEKFSLKVSENNYGVLEIIDMDYGSVELDEE
jgi:hypothetical protein